MVAKQELIFQNKEQQDEFNHGVTFLQQHHLRVIRKDRLNAGEKTPHVMLTDEDPFDLKYYEESSISTGCIFEAHKDSEFAMKVFIRMLGSYQKDYVESKSTFVYRLPAHKPMTVVLDSPGWEKALHLVEERFPGTVIWPEKT